MTSIPKPTEASEHRADPTPLSSKLGGATSPGPKKTHLCLLEVSSALGRQPHGTSCRLSRRLSTVTVLRCTT